MGRFTPKMHDRRPWKAQTGESGPSSPDQAQPVEINAGPLRLPGDLNIPSNPKGIVLFAHGSGSGRHSPRNRSVAAALNTEDLATLLFDLLTSVEEQDRTNVFDIQLLAERLIHATQSVPSLPQVGSLPVGYFGASTGAAAALWAAADLGPRIGAVVSRGGRPDLAMQRLQEVTAPTLLIVGGRDQAVLELNRKAQDNLKCENRLEIVPGATHLFEELGALETVAELARGWFTRHLATATP
jgi:putative phosphoribosyl transferase